MKRRTRKRGGPSVKFNESIFCSHCLKMVAIVKLLLLSKMNLPRHNKRWHSELDPVKDQAWMLVWTTAQGAGSSSRNHAFASFLRPRRSARPQPQPQTPTPTIIKMEPDKIIKMEPGASQAFMAASTADDNDNDTLASAQKQKHRVDASDSNVFQQDSTPEEMVSRSPFQTFIPSSSFPRSSLNNAISSGKKNSRKRIFLENKRVRQFLRHLVSLLSLIERSKR